MTITASENIPPTTPSLAPARPPRPMNQDEADRKIAVVRDQIDAVDDAIIHLIDERVRLSKNIGALRTSVGGTRLSLARENQIIAKFAKALGSHGTAMSMLLLKISRGRM